MEDYRFLVEIQDGESILISKQGENGGIYLGLPQDGYPKNSHIDYELTADQARELCFRIMETIWEIEHGI